MYQLLVLIAEIPLEWKAVKDLTQPFAVEVRKIKIIHAKPLASKLDI